MTTVIPPPVVVELASPPEPQEALARLAHLPHVVFFDSARRDSRLGRYSFLAADPFAFYSAPAAAVDSIGELASRAAQWTAERVAELPPFQGGLAGLFSYELGRQLERLPSPTWDEFSLPAVAIGWYDTVVAWDHLQGRAWIISHGFPERDKSRRAARAQLRAQTVGQLLARPRRHLEPPREHPAPQGPAVLAAAQLAPSFAVPGPAGLVSNFDRSAYLGAVERAIEYILAGDVFQVNLAQRLLFPAHGSSLELYARLRERNPATFAAYFDGGDFQLASATPERFLKVADRRVEARPIKGTRRRTRQPEADLFAGDDLQESAKDRAENVMIVDLLRNDLSRVCRPESVTVTQLCGLETYEFVQHLVSAVQGTLDDDVAPLDLLRAAFPGGSVTGAPKIRAMEIISELERVARGPYCGCLGYLGFDGTMDTNILIRTITSSRGWWQLPVGGGIVVGSEPSNEYEETWHKAEGLLRALN
ncbi:MAG: anthranilate synthase component I family protein [Pirellulales bacterium]|nr:anthranilate synthase component I family protein [Pirellulales bacterium]